MHIDTNCVKQICQQGSLLLTKVTNVPCGSVLASEEIINILLLLNVGNIGKGQHRNLILKCLFVLFCFVFS